MSDEFPSLNDALAPSVLQRMEEACDHFEAAWKAGERPRVEEYLGATGELERPHLLRELLSLELEYRLLRGESAALTEYVSRFPEHANLVEAVFLMRKDEGGRMKDEKTQTDPSSLVQTADLMPPPEPDRVPSLELPSSLTSPALPKIGQRKGGAEQEAAPKSIGRYRVIRLLGQGGFGRVYLAQDDELNRQVAIKVPRSERIARPEDIQAYQAEARILARLEHPNIVPVYDVGHTPGGLCYVVSKYIEGSNLRRRMKSSPLSLGTAVRLVADVAEAVDHAHRRQLVHCDIKPANILLDGTDKPFLADFGLALKDEDFGCMALGGTPNYMSPEQTRGEGHRIDGRSDIFSLGCVLYELCTGRRPFAGASQSEILTKIQTCEPTPPRQCNPALPEELERICLKALSKRAIDRYATAGAMAEDLRHLAAAAAPAPLPCPSPSGKGQDALSPPAPANDIAPAVIPRGLRSFDRDDADFFLTLLPGPRDRHGLPDSLRFWKTKIESQEPDRTFPVGVIYGPSGCGKSSLIKAGLLPRLPREVRPVYVEATPSATEAGLLRGLTWACPELPAGENLVDTLAAIRRGGLLPPGHKVLLVLDQFEQWLVSQSGDANAALVDALRQCDGRRLQAIILVRDDFWMAVTRFMAALEIRIVEGENSAAIDLFPIAHARTVLKSFGRAYGAVPASDAALTAEQNQFLDRSVAELAQEWKVIPVRLALFAEMVKVRPWTPATLKAVGGMQGVGVAFLEESFRGPTAPPGRRAHRGAAQAVLNLLLPEGGATIKGNVRSESELRAASGYAERPADFDELLRILDGELRLITPTETPVVGDSGTSAPGGRHYQLTHDFLVQSVRDWVTRSKQETWRGRAALRLAERTAFWTRNPENRYLPSLTEWASILLLTRRGRWNDSERRMMRRASWVNGLVVFGAVAVLAVLAAAGAITTATVHARGLVRNLLGTELDRVSEAVAALKHFRWWTDPELRQVLAESSEADEKLRASLGLLPVDPSQRHYLFEQLPQASPDQLFLLRLSLEDYAAELTPRLRDLLQGAPNDDPIILPTAAALAGYAPEDACWAEVNDKVSRALVRADFISLKRWLDLLRPTRHHLTGPLASQYREDPTSAQASKIADILSDYLSDDAELAADLLLDADPAHFDRLVKIASGNRDQADSVWRAELAQVLDQGETPHEADQAREREADRAAERARERLAARQARAAIALFLIGTDPDRLWSSLPHSSNPRVRSFVLDLLRPVGIERETLAARLRALPPSKGGAVGGPKTVLFDPVESTRRPLVLALGKYDAPGVAGDGPELIVLLLDLYENNADAGVHAAAEWTLRRWGQQAALAVVDARLRGAARGERRWYVSPHGLTFSLIDPPGEFIMGSRFDEPWKRRHESGHRRFLLRRYAIASKEVSVDQFKAFLKDDKDPDRQKRLAEQPPGTDPPYPQDNLTWFDAAAFCNWLSRQEGLTPCYLPNKKGVYGPGMTIRPDALDLSGYRLPTEAEWEYAARAGAVTSRYYGNADGLLARYAWTAATSGDRAHPCGELLPNDFGLFDTLGNLSEWVQNEARDNPPWEDGPVSDVLDSSIEINDNVARVLRGFGFIDREDDARVMRRDRAGPGDFYPTYGLRPVRTIP